MKCKINLHTLWLQFIFFKAYSFKNIYVQNYQTYSKSVTYDIYVFFPIDTIYDEDEVLLALAEQVRYKFA